MIEVADVGTRLPGGHWLFRDVSFAVPTGGSLAITGPSGVGKSSLLSGLGLLSQFDSGRYELDGENVATWSTGVVNRARARRIGFVFQNFSLINHLRAIDNVAAPLVQAGAANVRTARARSADALERVGLRERAKHYPGQLSGGEKQRVAIARALVVKPTLVLADEPTGSLDVDSATSVMKLLRTASTDQGAALLVVTHDPAIAATMDAHLELRPPISDLSPLRRRASRAK